MALGSELASYPELERLMAEASSALAGARIINVYHMEDDSLILKIRSRNFSGELRIIPGSFFYLVRGSYEKPLKPSSKAKVFRKYLAGAEIIGAKLIEGERIMIMELRKGGSRYKLISEFLPRGTIVLADENDLIIESLHRLKMRDRRIAPREPYKPPPLKPFPRREVLPKIIEKLSPRRSIVSALALEAGLGGRYAEEVLYLAGIEKSRRVGELEDEEKRRLINALNEVLDSVERGEPAIARSPDGELIPLPYRMKSLKEEGWSFKSTESLNEAFREAYEHKLAERIEREKLKAIEEEIERLRKEIDRRRYVAKELEERAKRMRAIAEKLFKISPRLDEIVKVEGLHEVDGLKIEVDHAHRRIRILVDGEKLELTTQESFMKQISRIFDDSKKSVEAAAKLLKEAEELRERVEKLEERSLEDLERALIKVSAKIEPHEKKWYERYRWFITSEGFLAVAGRDASSNISLLKKHLDPSDLVFHAEVRGAAAVILKDGERAGEGSRLEAAQFAATYSRAWKEKMTKMTVYYVKPDQISFTPPPGHYLPRGGFIVKGERSYLVAELELAFGLTEDLKLIYGPPKAVSRRTKEIVRVVPGDRRAEDLAREIVERLIQGLNIDKKSALELRRKVAELIPYSVGELA